MSKLRPLRHAHIVLHAVPSDLGARQVSSMSSADGDFTFPSLSASTSTKSPSLSSVPLTAKSTVTEAKSDGTFRAPKPLPAKQPIQRQKVPLEKGFSQVDWLKLSRTHPDLAGTGGAGWRKDIEMAEVKLHRTADDAWIVLSGKVYNMTHYLKFHPGGEEILLKVAGKDGTTLFQKYHPWVNADALLEKCFVGLMAQKPVGASPLQPAGESSAAS